LAVSLGVRRVAAAGLVVVESRDVVYQVRDVGTAFEDWDGVDERAEHTGPMERCAVHECVREATQPFTILEPKRRIFRKRDRVVMEAMICTEHNAAVEAGGMCAYLKPPGQLWVTEMSSA
jgi:hypothetical protein